MRRYIVEPTGRNYTNNNITNQFGKLVKGIAMEMLLNITIYSVKSNSCQLIKNIGVKLTSDIRKNNL